MTAHAPTQTPLRELDPHPMPVHLVGSLPRPLCDDPVTAMAWVLGHRGDAELTALPSDRDPRWIIDWLTHHLSTVSSLEQVRGGESRGYDDMPYYRVRPGEKLCSEEVGLARVEQARAAFEALDRLGLTATGEPPRVQVGIPNALDLAAFAFGSLDAAREWLPTMQAAVLHEVTELVARWGDRVQLQLETPTVLVAYHLTPPEAWAALTRDLTTQVAEVLAVAPRTRWVLHLCYGDLEHVPVFTPTDLRPAVRFLNALADALAARHVPMPTVHLPVACGAGAPPTDPAFYDDLRHLRRGVEVIAGVVAEEHPEETREALRLTAEALGAPVAGVAAACGYGRRTEDGAAANLRLAAELAREWSVR
ncbi:hypothetical protein ACIGNX_00260 [Actinosynnema sp. NPDC053489]|uniref:hypothetical protein n=1 Tax=Actinosynnema sp. NPDC053489 TaxID=3363916 RepID=UPI0037C7AE19